MIESILVPLERIAVIIGEKGKTKKEIEKLLKVKIEIDSENGEINIKTNNAINLIKANKIIKAIARGFNPEKAMLLTEDEMHLTIIDLREVIGKSKKAMKVKKARVIGKKGKAREKIEKETNTFVSVYGKTIAIIGRLEEALKAKKAIEMLLHGAKHNTVFNFLRKKERIKVI